MNNKAWFVAGVLTNSLILLIGIVIGLSLRPISKVHADDPLAGVKIEEIQPIASVGNMAVGVLLASRVESDKLVVNGYDVMKLQEGILNYLGSRPYAEHADIDNIVKAAKPDVFYRVKQPPQPPAAQPEKKDSKP